MWCCQELQANHSDTRIAALEEAEAAHEQELSSLRTLATEQAAMIAVLLSNDTGIRAWAEDSAARLGMANLTMGRRLDAVATNVDGRIGALEATLDNMTVVAGDPVAEAERLRESISAMNSTLQNSIATVGTMARRTEDRVSRIRLSQDPFPFMPMVRPLIVTHSSHSPAVSLQTI